MILVKDLKNISLWARRLLYCKMQIGLHQFRLVPMVIRYLQDHGTVLQSCGMLPQGILFAAFNTLERLFPVSSSPDGNQVVTGSEDNTAKLWDVGTGNLIRTFQHYDSVYSVSLSPNGNQLLTGSRDTSAKVWDVGTGNLIHTFQHAERVTSVSFSPDGNQVLTG